MRKKFLNIVSVVVVSVCVMVSFAACTPPLNESGDVAGIVTSETAQTETSSEAASSDPSLRPSSSSRPAISNSFEGSSSMTISEMQELDAEDKEKAYQLIKLLKQKDISKLRYYNQYTASAFVRSGWFDPEDLKDAMAVKTVTDKQEIKGFVNNLRLDTWYPGKWPILSMPELAICIDEDVKLGIICVNDGYSWLQISIKDKSYAYKAPIDLCPTLARDCELIKNPDEQTTSALVERLKQKEISALRYYEKKITNSLIYQPRDEFEGAEYSRVVTDSGQIERFIADLSLDDWESGDMRMTNSPLCHVYFDEDLYISLEDRSDDYFWVSIHTKDVSARYKVPRTTYQELERDITTQLYQRDNTKN